VITIVARASRPCESIEAKHTGKMCLGADQLLNAKERRKSCGAALEDSPRREPWESHAEIYKLRRSERKPSFRVLSPLRSSFLLSLHSHGSRRGLPSAATPWLKHLANSEMWPRALYAYYWIRTGGTPVPLISGGGRE
jgi:hypothetical protein